MNLKINNGLCELFCDDELILKFTKGSLAKRIYNNLNDKTLRIEDEYGFIQPGYYRGTDASNSRIRVWRIRDAEYLKKVRSDPTMRLLLLIFKPSATSLQLMYQAIQYTVQSQSKELLDDNMLMYYEDINEEGEIVEKSYDYGDGLNIQIQDLQALIGYDLQFLQNCKICRHCKKLYRPEKDEPYCCKTCRCELSRHRSPWCDAQLAIKKAINQEVKKMNDQLNLGGLQPAERAVLKYTLDTYNAAYNDWLTFSAGGNQSQAAKVYQLEDRRCSYTVFLQEWWERLCRCKQPGNNKKEGAAASSFLD